MKTKILFLFFLGAFLTTSNSLLAQEQKEIEVHTFQQRKTKHEDPNKDRTIIFISGVRDGKVCNVKLVSTLQGIVELKINDEKIAGENLDEYAALTDYIFEYANMQKVEGPVKVIEIEKPPVIMATDGQTNINDRIIQQLKMDKYIKEGDKVFDIVLSEKALFFNGKKLPDPVWRKYYNLYKELTGMAIGPTSYFHLSQGLD